MSLGDSTQGWSGLSSLEPEARSAVEGRIDQELARRAIAGSMVYFTVCLVVGIFTPYYGDHPLALMLVSCVTLLVGGLRLLSARQVLSRPDGNVSQAPLLFKATTYTTFVVWGLRL